MASSTIFPPSDLLQQIDGVEKGLRQRRRLGIAGWVALLGAALQTSVAVANSDWLNTLQTTGIKALAQWRVILPILVVLLSLLLIGWAKFWLKESKEAFRYTYSVGAFAPIEGEASDEILTWLQEDLARTLSTRVERLSLRPDASGVAPIAEGADDANEDAGGGRRRGSRGTGHDSHIHVRGTYIIRTDPEDRAGEWLIELTPWVRVGRAGSPEKLAFPVRYRLGSGKERPAITAEQYPRILERVYYSVATRVYKQIREDVQRKIELLPTAYFRAAAYLREGEDYARSNTLDAYVEAGELFDRARQLLDPRERPLPPAGLRRRYRRMVARLVSLGRRFAARLARVFPRFGRRELMSARADIGYANMLLYRRVLAGLSGRRLNPIYEARPVAERAVEKLARLLATSGPRRAYFDALVTLAFAWEQLDADFRAKETLAAALALDPSGAEQDPAYLFVQGMTELRPASRRSLFRQAAELDPRSEVAQFELAWETDVGWRMTEEMSARAATTALSEYEQVLRLNPGNLRARANVGYMRWLTARKPEDLREAKREYERGREYKEISRATFVADLDYGLARVEAELGHIAEADALIRSAVSAYVAQGVPIDQSALFESFFFPITEEMGRRFESYRKTVLARVHAAAVDGPRRASDQARRRVAAFAWNDFGEACYGLFLRIGDPSFFEKATDAYNRALDADEGYVFARFNLSILQGDEPKSATEVLNAIERLNAGSPDRPEDLSPLWKLPDGLQRLLRDAPEWLDVKLRVQQARGQAALRCSRTAAALNARGPQADSDVQRILLESAERGPGEAWQPSVFGQEPATRVDQGASEIRARLRKIPELRAYAMWCGNQAAELQRKVRELREQIDRTTRELLPHGWLWSGVGGSRHLDLAILDRRDLSVEWRWEREFEDSHVRALRSLADAVALPAQGASIAAARTKRHSRTPMPEADRLYNHLSEHFTPDNFEILVYRRDHASDVGEALEHISRIQSAILAWHRQQPTSYWALMSLLEEYEQPLVLAEEPSLPRRLRPQRWKRSGPGRAETRVPCRLVDLQEALEALTSTTIDETRLSPWTARWLGGRLAEIRDLSEGVDHLEQAISGFVADPEADPAELADALRTSGCPLPATDLVELSNGIRWRRGHLPAVVASLAKQRALLGSEDLVEPATRALSRALDDESDPEGLLEVGHGFRRFERTADAVEAYRRAARDVVQPAILLEVARGLYEVDDSEEATRVLTSAWTGADGADVLADIGDTALTNGDWDIALGASRKGLKASADGARTRLVVNAATATLAVGDLSKALETLAAESARADTETPAWMSALVGELLGPGVLPSSAAYHGVRDWLESRQSPASGALSDVRVDAGRAAIALLAGNEFGPRRSDEQLDLFPIVTPIIVEADAGLFPQDGATPGVIQMIETIIPAMKDRILETRGVQVPGVRIKANDTFGPREFRVLLHESPVLFDTIPAGEDPYVWLVDRGVEPMLRRHLDTYLGVQEVEDMLNRWRWEGDSAQDTEMDRPAKIAALLPDARSHLDFVAVLQRLVREQVNIANLRSVVRAFERATAAMNGGWLGRRGDVAEAMRPFLRDFLPSPRPGALVRKVPDEFARAVRAWTTVRAGRPVVEVPRQQLDTVAEFHSAVRTAIQDQPNQDDCVLVVDDDTPRRSVQALVTRYLPSVAVVAASELAPAPGLVSDLDARGPAMADLR